MYIRYARVVKRASCSRTVWRSEERSSLSPHSVSLYSYRHFASQPSVRDLGNTPDRDVPEQVPSVLSLLHSAKPQPPTPRATDNPPNIRTILHRGNLDEANRLAAQQQLRDEFLQLPGPDFAELLTFTRRKAGITPRATRLTQQPSKDTSRDFFVKDLRKALDSGSLRFAAYIASRRSFRLELTTLAAGEILALLDFTLSRIDNRFPDHRMSPEEQESYNTVIRTIKAHLLPSRQAYDTSPPSKAEVDRLLLGLRMMGDEITPQTFTHFETSLKDNQFTLCLRALKNPKLHTTLSNSTPTQLESLLSLLTPTTLSQNTSIPAETIPKVHAIRSALLSALFKSLCSPSLPQPQQSDPKHLKRTLLRATELLTGEAERKYAVRPSLSDHICVTSLRIRQGDLKGALQHLKSIESMIGEDPMSVLSLVSEFAKEREWEGVKWVWERVKKVNPLVEGVGIGELVGFVRMHLAGLDGKKRSVVEEGVGPLDLEAVDAKLRAEVWSCKDILTTVLERFLGWDMPDEAVDVFRLMQSQSEVRPGVEVYKRMIRSFARNGQVGVGVVFARDAERDGVGRDLDVEVVSVLIVEHLSRKRRANAYGVFEAFRKLGRYPDAKAYESLVGAAVGTGNWTRVWDLWREVGEVEGRINCRVCENILAGILKSTRGSCVAEIVRFWTEVLKRGVEPSSDMFNIVLSAHGRDGDLGGQARILEMMKEKGIEWDAFTLDAIVAGHLKRDDFAKAYDLYKEKTSFSKIVPKRATVNRLIRLAPDSPTALEIWENAQSHFRFELDHTTQSVLTKARALTAEVAPKGKLSDAGYRNTLNQQVHMMKDLAQIETLLMTPLTEPDSVTYTILIKKYLEKRDFPSAENVYRRMITNPSTYPTSVTFLTILKYCSDTANLQALNHYVGELTRYISQPTLKILATLITAFSKLGDLKAAEEWYTKTTTSLNLKPDTATHNALLSARARSNDIEGLQTLWKDMQKRGQSNRVTFEIVLRALCKNTSTPIEKCVKILRKMEDHPDPNIRPKDNKPYTYVIAAYGSRGDLKSALATYHDMLERGISPSRETHSAVISAFVSGGDLEGGRKWFDRVFGGVEPVWEADAVSFAPIVAGLAERGDWEGVQSLVGEME
ncbi:hypothetical protein HK097_003625, partial [Rhizophlyctis rosea]